MKSDQTASREDYTLVRVNAGVSLSAIGLEFERAGLGKNVSAERVRQLLTAARQRFNPPKALDKAPVRQIPVSTLLPKDVRDELVAASKVTDSGTRLLMVEQAIERARRKYPTYFQQEQ